MDICSSPNRSRAKRRLVESSGSYGGRASGRETLNRALILTRERKREGQEAADSVVLASPSSSSGDYDIRELDSSDETDTESRLRRRIPKWAKSFPRERGKRHRGASARGSVSTERRGHGCRLGVPPPRVSGEDVSRLQKRRLAPRLLAAPLPAFPSFSQRFRIKHFTQSLLHISTRVSIVESHRVSFRREDRRSLLGTCV